MLTRKLLDDSARDTRFAARQLFRRPAFAAVAIATLALGIGAPTAIFSVVQAVLLRPLPYPDAERLVRFRLEGGGASGRVAFDALPAEAALQWTANTDTLADMALFNDRALTLSSANGPFRLLGIAATPNLFRVLGIAPAIGRGFVQADDLQRIVLSHDTWHAHFAGNPQIVGSSITLDGERYVVEGVMPRGFGFPTPDAAFWVPLRVEQGSARGMLLPAIARLRPEAGLPAVLEEGRRMLEDTRGGMPRHILTARTMHDQMVGGISQVLWVLMAAVAIVFVIAAANIALLLLTRGAVRQREFSVRVALGAGRASLIRQLLIEGATLSVFGGIGGMGVAVVSLKVLLRLAPADMPRLQEASLDGSVLAFATTLTVLTSLVFGILSAGRVLATDPVGSLARSDSDARRSTGRSARRRLNALVAGELALTIVLLVAAGLLLRSFVSVLMIDQGFRHRGALALQLNLPSARYPSPGARLAFHERLLERLQGLDGVESAGLITMMPNRQPSARFILSSTALPEFIDPMNAPVSGVRTASEGFFEAMGIPLLAGRTFRADDRAGAEEVIVISETLARQQFADRPAVGEMLYSGTGNRTVIGVVKDVRPATQDADFPPAAYLSMRQDADVFQWFGTVTVVVRSNNLERAAGSVRGLVLSLDPAMPPFNVRTLSDEVGRLVAVPRFSAAVLALFAAVALVLAAVGVYGVMSYAAGQRTREIGIRIALGATRRGVLRLMLRDGVAVVFAGLLIGLPAAMVLSRALTGLLHEVTPADPAALLSVATLLALVAIAAAYVPARRATRISAMEALRDE